MGQFAVILVVNFIGKNFERQQGLALKSYWRYFTTR